MYALPLCRLHFRGIKCASVIQLAQFIPLSVGENRNRRYAYPCARCKKVSGPTFPLMTDRIRSRRDEKPSAATQLCLQTVIGLPERCWVHLPGRGPFRPGPPCWAQCRASTAPPRNRPWHLTASCQGSHQNLQEIRNGGQSRKRDIFERRLEHSNHSSGLFGQHKCRTRTCPFLYWARPCFGSVTRWFTKH